MTQPRFSAALLLCLLAAPSFLLAQETPVQLRYDLQPGDHLTYREVFERAGKNKHYGYDFRYRKEWTSHVLVVSRDQSLANVGFQRNLTDAQLLRFRPKGKDKLEEERPRFAQQVADQPPHFAEANRLDAAGWPQRFWSAVRESWSEVLFDLHELPPLPTDPVRPGDTWKAPSPLGMTFQASGWDRLHDEPCLRVDATGMQNNFHLRYWFCTESNTIPRLEFQGHYTVFGGGFDEKLTLELLEHQREQPLQSWLDDPELRLGTLTALNLTDTLPVTTAQLDQLLNTEDAQVQHQTLTVIYRRQLPAPPLDILAALLEGSPDARVRALAVRVLERVPKQAAHPLLRHALEDEDYFVHRAALDWVRDRLPPRQALDTETPQEAQAAWDTLGDLPLALPADSADGASTNEAASCSDVEDWTARTVRARRLPAELPGTTVRGMTTAPYRGWPYVIHIPEDYRGDKPFPLLIYLSGDSGRAMHGVRYAFDTLPQLGYLVLFPQADGFWWDAEPTARSTALLAEILHGFNVDTNRVYLAGTSNGGTGMIHYAAWWNDHLAAGVSLMGAGVYSANNSEPPLLVNLLHLPFLFVHGEKDKTIPAEASRTTYEEMRKLDPKAPVSLDLLRDHEHDLVLDNDDGLTLKFLQQHVRNPYPRTVVFQAADMRFPRRFWLEILEKEKGLAEVQGLIEEDNTIRVDTHGVKRLRLLLRPELLPRAGSLRVVLDGKEVFKGNLPEDCALLQESWQQSADPFLAYSAELTFDTRR